MCFILAVELVSIFVDRKLKSFMGEMRREQQQSEREKASFRCSAESVLSCPNEIILFSRGKRKEGWKEIKRGEVAKSPGTGNRQKLDRYHGITSNLGREKLGKTCSWHFSTCIEDSSTGTRVCTTFFPRRLAVT